MNTKENRELKNSVFVDLFYEDESADENDIVLYNALHEEPLPKGTKVQKIRVDIDIGRASVNYQQKYATSKSDVYRSSL